MQDVDIKRQGAASAYAFVQYTDISSVVHALREMEGEHIGANKIKVSLTSRSYWWGMYQKKSRPFGQHWAGWKD